ncbi:MAG: ABC transporter permease subunit [Phycisphaerales bacterium]
MLWLTGGALTICLGMILLLFAMVLINGSRTFWPQPIHHITLDDGQELLGIRTDHQQATETTEARTLYRVGNRDIGQASFRWINDAAIAAIETPEHAVMLEREAWGIWLGYPEQIIRVDEGGETDVVADGPVAFFDAFRQLHEKARQAMERAERLKRGELGDINHQIGQLETRIDQAEIEAGREGPPLFRFSWLVWGLAGLVVAGLAGSVYRMRDYGTQLGSPHARKGKMIRGSATTIAGMLLVALLVAAPWKADAPTQADVEAMREHAQVREAELLEQYETVLAEIREIEDANSGLRAVVREPTTERFSPTSQTQADEPLQVGQVVRMVRANTLSVPEKFGVYFSRWWEYISTFPREANTEGGVYPVIVGTVLLTMLLTIFVTPLGVIAALYLREYAKQGLVTSMIRIAVNNLAGVPSIVYGVFGLGFFCYTVGSYVDTGPSRDARLGVETWWGLFVFTSMAIIAGIAMKLWSKPDPGKVASRSNMLMQRASWAVWGVCAVLVVVLVAKTPYFHGFFEARAQDGTPTFGTRGLLWASLTLALLTLPVVIVATEEAIAAVPNSMRQGSYGCGASKWQTMRRIVLPGALPGILTGAILAMARGAGEVAPLMLVGAVKLNQDLPVSTQAPYLHADRSFMHLGFHIFDLGFQSPDSQAARPLVWTTTLLFLTLVFMLNLLAIMLRSKIRARMAGPTV